MKKTENGGHNHLPKQTRWVGVILMVAGELGNLTAYGFAPAAIVTPMGAIGVVCNLFVTTLVLKEKVRAINVAGIGCVIVGIVLIVVFAPHTNIDITSGTVVQQYILTNQMGIYLIIWATLFVMMLPLCKRFGQRTVIIYVATGSVVASLTIVSAKVFSSLVTRGVTLGFDKDWITPVPYLALLFLVITAVGSMHFVNMAMMKYGNSQVRTPPPPPSPCHRAPPPRLPLLLPFGRCLLSASAPLTVRATPGTAAPQVVPVYCAFFTTAA